jgi:glycosyltransferase involved in cell wall biosynthesis
MRIAVVGAKGLPPTQGGIEHYCAELYPRLVEEGYSVSLFSRQSYTRQTWFYEDDFHGVKVITLPSVVKGGLEAFTSSAVGALISSLKSDYDIVHFHALGPSLFSWIPRLSQSMPIVVTCHGLDWQRDKWGKFASSMIKLGEKAAVQYADRILVVSEDLQTYFEKQYGRQVTYVPNAPAGYAQSDQDFAYVKSLGLTPHKYFVFLGRLVPEKCPDLLIRAFQQEQIHGWKLALVGGISDMASYSSSLLRMKGQDENIVFTGTLKGKKLAELVRGAGIFVLPSSLEGMPLAVLEAIQEGIPVIGSDIPPLKSLLGDGRGLIFTQKSPDSLSQGLQWAASHPQEMFAMARKAQEYVIKHHNWEIVAQKHMEVYESVALKSVSSIV